MTLSCVLERLSRSSAKGCFIEPPQVHMQWSGGFWVTYMTSVHIDVDRNNKEKIMYE